MAGHQQRHCLLGQPLLIGASRIDFDLSLRLPSEDRHELVRRRPVLSGDDRAGLAEPVSGAVLQPGFITPITEPVAEPGCRERSAQLSDQMRQVSRGGGVDGGPTSLTIRKGAKELEAAYYKIAKGDEVMRFGKISPCRRSF
jgi:hypothetical protein